MAQYRILPGSGSFNLTIQATGPNTPLAFLSTCYRGDGSYTPPDLDWTGPRTYWTSYAAMATIIAGGTPPPEVAGFLHLNEPGVGNPYYTGAWSIARLHEVVEALDMLGSAPSIPANTRSKADGFELIRTGELWPGGPGPSRNIENCYRAASVLDLLGYQRSDAADLNDWLQGFQCPNGAWSSSAWFNACADPTCTTWRTYYAVYTILHCGGTVQSQDTLFAWLETCHNPDGGYTNRVGHGSDLLYTWCALKTYALLGRSPPSDVSSFVHSCQNPGGGFGDRPGRHSRCESTYYAVDILSMLGEDTNPAGPTLGALEDIPSSYHVYTALFETGGHYSGDSISDLAFLAGKVGCDIFGIKSGSQTLQDRAQLVADTYGFPIHAVKSREAYGADLMYYGYPQTSHCLEMANEGGLPGVSTSTIYQWDHAFSGVVPFRDLLAQLRAGGGASYHSGHVCPFEYGQERMWLIELNDLSLEEEGYDMQYFGSYYYNQWPDIDKFRGEQNAVQSFDAHKHCWQYRSWWTGNRMLFIGPDNSWTSFRAALDNKWVMVAENNGLIWGKKSAVGFARARQAEWQFWDNEKEYPRAMIVPITSLNSWEWPGFTGGAVLRVRAETVPNELRVDGAPQPLTYQGPADANDAGYWYVELPGLAAGGHTAEIDYGGVTSYDQVNFVIA